MNEQAIFLAALEILDPSERQAHVLKACAGDEALRRQVESLLAAHELSGAFLDVPALEQIGTRASPPLGDTEALAMNAQGEKFVAEPDNDEKEEGALTCLEPSTKAGSLGRLAQYEVLEILGKGGFGTVVRAFDEKLQRVVAIKIMSSQMASTSPPRKRFLREARASAKIRHENVVAIYDIQEQPIPYLVMEYIPGETLQQKLNRVGPFDVMETLRLGQQIAAGLAAAHAQGLIHRDIKPSNILLENGIASRIKITDFGLARAADDASMTQSGVIAGTPMYMAPEQAQGAAIDHRADLFSFGSVLYVMCSGRPPFRAANTLAVMKRVAEDTPRPIREIIPEVPQWLCDVVTKLHAKAPQDRFGTAQEVADLFGRYLAELHLHGRVQEAGVRGQEAGGSGQEAGSRKQGAGSSEQETVGKEILTHRPMARPKRRWMAAAAILVLLGFVGLGLTEVTNVTNLRGTIIQLFSPEGTLIVEVDDPDVSVSIEGEEVVIKGAGTKEIRVKPGQYKVQASKDGKVVRQELVTVSKNGRQIVRISREIDPPAKVAIAAAPIQYALDFSAEHKPGSARVQLPKDVIRPGVPLTFEMYLTPRSISAQGNLGNLLWNLGRFELKQHGNSWSLWNYRGVSSKLPSDGILARDAVQPGRRRHLACVSTGTEMRLFVDGELIESVKLTVPLNNFIVQHQFGGWSLDLKDSVPFDGFIDQVRISKKARYDTSFRPDARMTSDADTVALYNFDEGTGDVLKDSSGNGHHGKIVGAKWVNADGTEIAPLANLETILPDPIAPRLKGHPQQIREVGYLPDGKRAVSIGLEGCVFLWDLTKDAPIKNLHPAGERLGLHSMALSPDGKMLAVGTTGFGVGEDSSIYLYDLEKEQYLRGFPVAPSNKVDALAFTPDGQRLVVAAPLYKRKPGDEGIYIPIGAANLFVFDVADGKKIASYDLAEKKLAAVCALALLPGGKQVLCLLDGVSEAVLWDLEKGAEVRRYPVPEGTWVLALFPDGNRVATANGGPESAIRIWSLDGKVPMRSWQAPLSARLKVLHGGRWILSTHGYVMNIWEVATGKLLNRVGATSASFFAVDVGADGKRALTGFGSSNDKVPDFDVQQWRLPAPGPIANDRASYALDFSAELQPFSARVELPNNVVNTSAAFTIELFITPRSRETNKVSMVWYLPPFQLRVNNTNWGLFQGPGGKRPQDGVITQGECQAGRRGHRAGISPGTEIRLFVDGEMVGTRTLTTPPNNSAPHHYLGGSPFPKGPYVPFDGFIDQVRISKGVRHTKNFKPDARMATDADTVALYNFDEGQGDMLKDSSGNNHHGKIVGAKWVKVDGTPLAPEIIIAGQPKLRTTIDAKTSVVSLLFAPDGKSLVAGGDGHFTLFDPVGGGVLHHHQEEVGNQAPHFLDVSQDGKILAASGQMTKSIRIFDLPNRKPIIDIPVKRAPFALALSPDGKTLVHEQDVAIVFHDLATGVSEAGAKKAGRYFSLKFSPDGQHVATILSNQGTSSLLIFDAKTRKQVMAKSVAAGWCDISRDGTRIAVAVRDKGQGTFQIWSFPEGDLIYQQTVPALPSSGPLIGTFSPDGNYLALGVVKAGVDKNNKIQAWELQIWDLRQQKMAASWSEDFGPLAFSADGKTLATGGMYTNKIKLWDLTTSNTPLPLLTAGVPKVRSSMKIMPPLSHLAFTPNGSSLIATGWNLTFFDPLTGTMQHQEAPEKIELREKTLVTAMSLAADRKTLAYSGILGASGFTRVLQLPGRNKIADFKPKYVQHSTALSPDGQTLVYDDQDGLMFREVLTGKADLAIKAIKGKGNRYSALQYSPDGRFVTGVLSDNTLSDNTTSGKGTRLVILDAKTHAQVVAKDQDGLSQWSDISSDSKWIVLGGKSDNKPAWHLFSLADGNLVHVEKNLSALSGCGAFAPDGIQFALGCADGTVQIWDAAAKKMVLSWKTAHAVEPKKASPVAAIAYSPDGNTLATASSFGDIQVWDLTRTDMDPDRKVAADLTPFLDLTVRLGNGSDRVIKPGDALPAEPFRLVKVATILDKPTPPEFLSKTLLPALGELEELEVLYDNFGWLGTWSDADLDRLAELKSARSITDIYAWGIELSPRAIDAFKRMPKLASLGCKANTANDALLVRLGELPALSQHLRLHALGASGKLTGRGWQAIFGLKVQSLSLVGPIGFAVDHAKQIAVMPTLENINLNVPAMAPEVVAELAKSKTLRGFILVGPTVTDEMLDLLRPIGPRLYFVSVAESKVTKAGAEKFAAAFPRCKVVWDGSVIGPGPAADPDRCAE